MKFIYLLFLFTYDLINMSNHHLTGKVFQISQTETGISRSGKEWSRQDFVIDTDEKYTKKVCFSLFNDNCDLLSDVSEGDKVDITFGMESKEFNGRWFTNLTAFGVSLLEQNSDDSQSHEEYPEPDDEKDLPF